MRTNPEQFNPYDEPQEGVWCSEHGRWECDEHGYDDDLDKVEATCQFYDELEAKRDKEDLQGGNAGGSDLCVHVPADSPAPLLLRYPVWEQSFHEYGWGI